MLLKDLRKKKLISPPPFVVDDCHYLALMGSVAYGCSSDTSDCDIYGFCIPGKHIVFPHIAGHIQGFGKQAQGFDQWSEHHVNDKSKDKSYDFAVYSIVKYFQLCMDCNPNMIDSLFVPENCVLEISNIGRKVRANRTLFLHKGCYHKFKGYAWSQLKKMETKSPIEGSKRNEVVNKYGFDVKFAYHLVRLLDECEQILQTGELDLQRSHEVLKAIRRGEWSKEKIKDYFASKEGYLDDLYHSSSLRDYPDEKLIKGLLIECLEDNFGSLDMVIPSQVGHEIAIHKIKEICEAYTR